MKNLTHTITSGVATVVSLKSPLVDSTVDRMKCFFHHPKRQCTMVMNGIRYFCQEQQEGPKRFMSAIQPTGSLHLGNYLGAVKRWVELQNSGEDTFYSIADLHAITIPQDPKVLQKNIMEMAASLVACGIDPEKSVFFQQSKVQQHTQLCWVLGSLTSMAKLGQQTQLKEKRSVMLELSSSLYLYPVLQAADILLYRATHVPVGEDQRSHLQLAVYLARSFNKKFGKTFVVPSPLINADASSRLKNLRQPLHKMSKSDPEPKSRINVSDSPDEIVEKCKKAVTDCISAVTYEPETRPGVSNLILIHSLLSGKSVSTICQEASTLDTGKYKLLAADEIVEALKPVRTRFYELIKDNAYLRSVLDTGAIRAQSQAEQTWMDVKIRTGFEYGLS